MNAGHEVHEEDRLNRMVGVGDLLALLDGMPRASAAQEARPRVQWPERWGEEHVEVYAASVRQDHTVRQLLRARPREPWASCGECVDGFTWRTGAAGREEAVACRCQVLRERCEMLSRSGLPALAVGRTLRSFDWTVAATRGGAALRPIIERFVTRCWTPGGPGLLFEGDNGRGKSHLAYGIVQYMILRRGIPALFVEWPDLLHRVRESFDAPGHARSDIIAPLLATPLLVVDELGGDRTTPWSVEEFESVIQARVNACGTVVLATNLRHDLPRGHEMSLAGKVGSRAESRLHGACELVTLVGEDYRRRPRGA